MTKISIPPSDQQLTSKSITDVLFNWRSLLALATLLVTTFIFTVQFDADGPKWLLWTLTSLFIAMPTLPLTSKIFKATPGVIFPFSMALGLLILSFSSWTLAYLHILPFMRWSLFIIFALLSIFFWFKSTNRKAVLHAFTKDGVLVTNILFATAFVIGLGAWTYVRGLMPKIEGLEKFMDYGFMMSMWRTKWLPAKDMWLAGKDINYYYFGQFIYTLLSKFTNINPSHSYNLSMSSTFGYMLILSASLGYLLFTAIFKAINSPFQKLMRLFATIFSAFFVTIAGNSHSFFYATNGPGQRLLRWLTDKGIDVGSFDHFFFSDSTRYIGYNPDVADKTIHEFPYYSFLVADLHAHLVNTVFVLLLVGLLIAYFMKDQSLDLPPPIEGEAQASLWLRQAFTLWKRFLTEPTILLSGLLLAIFMMCNFWDFAIYLVVIVFIFFTRNLRDESSSGGIIGISQFCVLLTSLFVPFLLVENSILALICYLFALIIAYQLLRYQKNAWSRTGLQIASIFFLAHLFSFPFNLGFEAISKTIKLTTNQSTIQQLLILWGPHVLVAVILSMFFLIHSRRENKLDSKSILERLDGKALVLILSISGIGLILAPEVIYVKDIYEANYARANTMFKFTYQAFIILSLLLGIAIPSVLNLVFQKRRKKNKTVDLVSVALALAIILPLSLMPSYYPFVATPGWVPNPKVSEWQGLDGTTWMADAVAASGNVGGETEQYDLSVDYAAIQWFNEHVTGQPTILEAAGLSYTHLNRISAYTGLPTVFGWETHQWLWRTSKDTPNAFQEIVYPKQQDVKAIYTWSDEQRALNVLRDLNVEYIIIGELEILRYPDINLDVLIGLGETVFHQGLMRIIKINPYTLG